jgi:cytochrome P450
MGSGIFTQDGVAWKHSRDMLRPQFMSNRLQNFDQIKDCVQNLISNLPASGPVDLQPLFFRLTFDTTTFLLFGKSMSTLSSTDAAGKESEFAAAFNIGQDHLAKRGRLGDFYWVLPRGEFNEACKVCHSFVDSAVRDALEKARRDPADRYSTREYIFIDALAQETQDPKVLRDQCINILLAGRDTTACCLSWAL